MYEVFDNDADSMVFDNGHFKVNGQSGITKIVQNLDAKKINGFEKLRRKSILFISFVQNVFCSKK